MDGQSDEKVGNKMEQGKNSAHLFEQAPFLNDIGNSFHSDTFGFVNVLEGVYIASLLVLNDADLGEWLD